MRVNFLSYVLMIIVWLTNYVQISPSGHSYFQFPQSGKTKQIHI